MLSFNFHSDPGHGWLCVPMEAIVDLGLKNKITEYSYVKDGLVYLEEDCDAPLFMKTLKAYGMVPKIVELDSLNTDHWIRRCKRYSA